MNFKSKKTPLLILGITSILCSRSMFVFFDDTEGPNLLIVMVMAAVIYFLSLIVYLFKFSSLHKLLLSFSVQILLVTVFYFSLR